MPNVRILPEFWSTKKAAQLGALARYQLYGNPGTFEGRRRAGLLLQEKIRANPDLAKQWRVALAKEIKHPPLSPLLAEFVGILLGDGGVRSALQVTVSFNREKEMAYAHWIQGVVRRLFGLDSALSLRKDNLGGDVVVSSSQLVRYLAGITGLKPGNKLHGGLDVPEWIWGQRTYKISCLRGLMDTDGSLYLHRYQVNGRWYAYPKLCVASASSSLLSSIYRLFSELGFHPRMTSNKLVFIDRTAESRRFYRVVGSRHKRNCDKIEKFS